MQGIQYRSCRKWFLVCLVCGWAVVCGVGCIHDRVSIKSGNLLDVKEGLAEAYNQYWRFVAGKEVKKAFACEAPYVQDMVYEGTYRIYQGLFAKVDLQGVEVYDVLCKKPFLCCIDSRVTYDAGGKKDVRDRRDCWVLVKGRWYHVLESPLIFPQLGWVDG